MFAIWALKGALIVVRLFVGENVDDEHCRAAYRTRRSQLKLIVRETTGLNTDTAPLPFSGGGVISLSHRRLAQGPVGDVSALSYVGDGV